MRKIFSIVILTALCAAANAQSVPFIIRNTDARSFAMASVGTENLAAGNALSGKKLDVEASYDYISPDYSSPGMIGFNGYGNIGKFSVGLTGRFNLGKEYEIMGDVAQSLGVFQPFEYSVGASLAYAISKKFALGAKASYISSKLIEDPSTAFGIDLSAAYKANGLKAELAIRNLGSKITYGEYSYKLPALAALGVSYNIGGFTAQAEAGYMFAGSFMAGVGAEYTVKDIVSFRAGYHYGESGYVPSFASLGLGLNIFGAKLNFTYVPIYGSKGSALMGGIGYSF